MFTGLVENVGRVADIEQHGPVRRVRVETALAAGVSSGDSVAVSGVCLTVTAHDSATISADIGPETIRVTTLGLLRSGSAVNLERSMRADGRFGGHFVQGHVDGLGSLEAVRRDGDAHWITIGFPSSLASLFVSKGSVAVDGVSLTIADLRDGQFDVMIIPFTWTATSLSALRPGDRVNLECDMIGKYVARALETRM
jgi:riboflavin synthase